MAIINISKLKSSILVQGETVEVTNQSNACKTQNLTTDISMIKTATKTWGLPASVLTISTQIVNNTDLTLTEIHFADTLTGATFVDGSLKIGEQEYQDCNPLTGFDMPVTLGGVGADLTISYNILIDEFTDLDQVLNTTTLTITENTQQYQVTSSQLDIDIIHNDITLYKHASSTAVVSGGTLTYTIEITNAGDYTNTNLVFSDTLPQDVEFVAGSIQVDSISKPDATLDSLELGSLTPDQTITITFQVTIK